MASIEAMEGAFRARALLLAARFDLRNWPENETLARAPLAVKVPSGGVAVIFRYGVVVLFDVASNDEEGLRARLMQAAETPYTRAEIEELDVRIDATPAEGLQEGRLVVQARSLERLQLIAEALSKSLLLGHYETRLAADFDLIEPLALQLEHTGRIRGSDREHLKRIGALLLIEARMVGRAAIGDKPELLWDHPELERLNALLEDEFEIHERLAALDRKLELAARTERTLVDLLSAKHMLRVEWYIVLLIVFEIALTLFSMLGRAG